MPLSYTEINKETDNRWEQEFKKAWTNINKKNRKQDLLLNKETEEILTRLDETNEETEKLQSKLDEPTTWKQFKIEYPTIAQAIKTTKNTAIKAYEALIILFENSEEQIEKKMSNKKIEEQIETNWKKIKDLEEEICVDELSTVISCSSLSTEEKNYRKIELLLIRILSCKISELQMSKYSSEKIFIINEAEKYLKKYDKLRQFDEIYDNYKMTL